MEKVGSTESKDYVLCTEDVAGVGMVVQATPQPLPQVDQRPGAMTASASGVVRPHQQNRGAFGNQDQAWSREHSHVPSATPPTYRLFLGSRKATRKSRYDSE